MTAKAGSVVKCFTCLDGKSKKICHPYYAENDESFGLFQVLRVFKDGNKNYYTVLVEKDYIGWNIGKFLTVNAGVDEKFLGQKFYDVPEDWTEEIK